MTQTKYNRLIINSGISDSEGCERIFLFRASNLRTVAFNNEAYSYAQCYRLNDDGYMERAEDVLWEDDFDELYYESVDVTRKKSITLNVMTDDEAIVQMEMLGHSFFVYLGIDGETKVIYKRKKGYGVLVCE